MTEDLEKIEPYPFWLKPLKEEDKPHYTECEKYIITWTIAWEGSLEITEDKGSYYPKIVISNTDFELIENFAKIIKLGHIRLRTLKEWKPEWKPQKILEIASIHEVNFILEQLKGYMPCTKYRKLRNLVSEFCKSRIKEHSKRKREAPYSERDLQIVNEVHELNKRGQK